MVPVPPDGPNEAGEGVAETAHFAALGVTTFVDEEEQAAQATASAAKP